MKKILNILTVISAVVLGAFVSCTTQNEEVNKKVENVILSSTDITMVKGDVKTIVAKILPEGAQPQETEWSVDNSNVTVEEGKITAVEVGSSVVTFVADGIAATCKVTVVPEEILPESVSVVPSSIEVNYEKVYILDYGIQPKNATEIDVTWKSEDESIVTVDQSGIIKAVGLGEADVTVTTVNNKVGKCHVTVVGKKIEDFSLVYSGMELGIGAMEYQYIAELLPADAADKTIIWTSEDEKVGTVEWDEEGQRALITATGEGYKAIVATAASNPDLVRKTWINVAQPTPVPYRFGWDWILINCQFRIGDQENAKDADQYFEHLKKQGMSGAEANARIDLLERYFSYLVHDQDAKDYVTLTITTEDGTQYQGQTISFKQLREDFDITHYQADFDLSSAPQEIQDKYAVHVFTLDAWENYWTIEFTFEEYDVTVIYTWRAWGDSVLD